MTNFMPLSLDSELSELRLYPEVREMRKRFNLVGDLGECDAPRNVLGSIPVFYTPKMVSKPKAFSPSPGKPIDVVSSWKELGFRLNFPNFERATRAELCMAHSPEYVNGVLDGSVPNGFGGTDLATSKALPWTSGAMLAAARAALRNRMVAVAPCSGFHHAGYNAGGGFCTFNGLMVTACALNREGVKVGILDLDMHYGNGTDDIIRRLDVPASQVQHFTAGRNYRRKSQAAEFLHRLPGIVASFEDCDVLLYQAGADPHIDDPLGGWLTDYELFERDRLVFQTAKDIGLPVAWNLAGGYQDPLRKVLDIHDSTMIATALVYME